jgi:hypothetical protein
MNNNTVLALVFLIAGTLLTTTAVSTLVPAAYADNKQKAEDESAAAIADCDDNDVQQAGFDCFGIALNDIELDLGGGEEVDGVTTTTTTPSDLTTETETEETGIMSNPLFNLGQ